jgi:hypothetical protein
MPKEVFGMVDIADVWRLALHFRDYDGLFSHRILCHSAAARRAERGMMSRR